MATPDYYLICPHCGNETNSDPEMLSAGDRVICPHCDEPIDIEEIDETPEE